MKTVFYFTLLLLMCASCRHSDLEQALKMAGANRAELEQVLGHYSQNPADSLKYRAAVFLIENMPAHYYIKENPKLYDIMDSLNCSNLSTKEVYARFDSIEATIPLQLPEIVRDILTLTSEFLIQHIDESFENWENSPWKESISFDDFCEYILPYQAANEKREFWINHYRSRYEPYLTAYLQHPGPLGINLKDACNFVNDSLINSSLRMVLDFEGSLGNYSPLEADNVRSGTCGIYMARTVYLMRSLGIPVSQEFAPQWGSYTLPHSWNSVLTETGRHFPFLGFDEDTEKWKVDLRFECSKMFRITYSAQKSSPAAQFPKEPIPGFLKQANLIDVTAEYLPVSDVTIPIKKPQNIHSNIAYLHVFNNETWIPVHWGKIRNGTATFTDMGRKVAYLPAFYTGKNTVAAGNPFLLDSLGNIILLNPHPTETQTLKLERKFHVLRFRQYHERMLYARFQGANRPDFSDGEDFYTINQLPRLSFNTAEISANKSWRYVRYIPKAGNYANVAELEFYYREDNQYKKLSGKIIGTDGSVNNLANRKKEVAFDGDVLTFFSHEDANAWVGLDLGKPERIDRIRFLPRNDDNNIRPGDLYELFYWDNGKWNSLGQKTGDESYVLVYDNCPAGALFLLHNHTRGKEERPFTYENGKQVWW